jgi:hypothetical protein
MCCILVYTIFNCGKIIAQNQPPRQKPGGSNRIERKPEKALENSYFSCKILKLIGVD